MLDPIPTGFTTLPQAVRLLTSVVTDREIEAAQRDLRKLRETLAESNQRADVVSRFMPPEDAGSQSLPEEDTDVVSPEENVTGWNKRELAIVKMRSALHDGALIAFVRDPGSGEMFCLEPEDWRGAAFWQDIIRGGVIRSSACESIERHDGRRVLVEEESFNRWLAEAKKRLPAAAVNECQVWLEGEMRKNLKQNSRPKADWRREAGQKFAVSDRAFDRVWAHAVAETGSKWASPGRKSAH